jgi:hypothetical protein
MFAIPIFSVPAKAARAFNEAGNDTVPTEKLILYHSDPNAPKDRQQKYLQNLSKIMGLPTLTDQKTGIYIRIWNWDLGRSHVINICIDSLKKVCNVVRFSGKNIDSNQYIVIQKEWKNLQPKSGWSNLLVGIKSYHILDMQSGKTADEYPSQLTEMAYVQFEISEAGRYRFYEYLEPSWYRNIDPGAMNVFLFLKALNNELGVPVYSPANGAYVP